MKKYFIILIVMVISLSTSNAQYKTFVFGNLSYDVDCFYNSGGFITIKIKMASLDLNQVEMMIGNRVQYDSFIDRLNYSKTKIAEWDSVCKINNITKIDKLIDFKAKSKEEPFIWFGKYYNTTSLTSTFSFNNGTSSVILHSGRIHALSNKYITCDGGMIIFYSANDIQEMIDEFNLDKIRKYIDDKNKTNELLK
ncbi:MAG: hypothetical protein H6Q18_109 [Bacteroidetes bacterium]|nr:hypothetical protein [Bacteroidota bacterium]